MTETTARTITPAMCVAASDAAMARGIILPASHAAPVIDAALSASPATSGRFATPDHVVAEVWRHLPKTPSMWEVVEPLSPPPLWLYEAMDKALSGLPAPAVAEGWRSMDSAPKDGTNIIVAVPHNGGYIVSAAYFDPDAYDGTWWWSGSGRTDYGACDIEDGNEGPPVAWMPLPPAPAAAPSPAPQEALTDERGVSKLLMDLLREMHEAPTMAAGYEMLADFTAQAGLGVPVPMRSATTSAGEALTEAVRAAHDRLDTIAAEDGRVGVIADLVRSFAALAAARKEA